MNLHFGENMFHDKYTRIKTCMGSIHDWGTKKGKKDFKDFLKLLFTHNIYMKQSEVRKIK